MEILNSDINIIEVTRDLRSLNIFKSDDGDSLNTGMGNELFDLLYDPMYDQLAEQLHMQVLHNITISI